jgi:glyceraldehyde 3-phosphate dehydrogenase
VIEVDGHEMAFFSSRSPGDIPWGDVGAQVVIESTGAFRGRADASGHLDAGADGDHLGAFRRRRRHVRLRREPPGLRPDSTRIISNASCTTNCLAPVAKVLNDSFGVEHLMMTTIHAYTSSQALMDTPSGNGAGGGPPPCPSSPPPPGPPRPPPW